VLADVCWGDGDRRQKHNQLKTFNRHYNDENWTSGLTSLQRCLKVIYAREINTKC